ncbi:MAG: hypothetical protein EAY66_01335 [Sphingobacteriales bacterium]|nr:MAG: hypothetical protein EAY66_01335 [Sphingobacteriales bacterium]
MGRNIYGLHSFNFYGCGNVILKLICKYKKIWLFLKLSSANNTAYNVYLKIFIPQKKTRIK